MTQRQGMSNILATIILIGAAVGGGGLLYALSTDMINTQFARESIEITSAKINNTDDNSWLTISIKNTGNSQLDTLKVTVNGLTVQVDESFEELSGVGVSLSPRWHIWHFRSYDVNWNSYCWWWNCISWHISDES